MTKAMMKCGHAANATTSGVPVCAICFGLTSDAVVVVDPPSLEGRTARCNYGPHRDVPSSTDLAFFAHQPAEPLDRYYCGCFGWD